MYCHFSLSLTILSAFVYKTQELCVLLGEDTAPISEEVDTSLSD